MLDIDPCKAVLNRAQASGHTAQRRQQGNRVRFRAADPSYVTHNRLINVSLCAARHLSRSVPRDRHRPLLTAFQSLCQRNCISRIQTHERTSTLASHRMGQQQPPHAVRPLRYYEHPRNADCGRLTAAQRNVHSVTSPRATMHLAITRASGCARYRPM